ncbi:Transcriptional regulatory protein KdpE [bioreactor metagenome]|uniref:Transcriptional regulatory protein KdpE n=1 Tax=bioreactor metagenome TaxID=1076179 RepID=A0A645D3K5_9ZZZZ
MGELGIDFEKHLVYLDNSELHVTPLEYNLLALFFKNMGKVLTTQYILKEIYGVGHGTDTQALRALMAGLRRKIEKNPTKPRYVLTEIGVGYRLVDE